MKKTLLIVPTSSKIDLSDISYSLVKSLLDKNKKVSYIKALGDGIDSTYNKLKDLNITLGDVVDYQDACKLIASFNEDSLLESYVEIQENLLKDNDILIVECPYHTHLASTFYNVLAQTLDGSIVIITDNDASNYLSTYSKVSVFASSNFNLKYSDRILGTIIVNNSNDNISKDWNNKHIKLLAELSNNLSCNQIYNLLQNSTLINDLVQESLIEHRISPAYFRYQLTKLSKSNVKTIVLPEGDEPRTIKAAIICTNKKFAKCILLASNESVQEQAKILGVTIPEDLTIIDPSSIRDKYVDQLVELRAAKGMTKELAIKELQDNVVLGTMMLHNDEVDGLVSGAVHTTANTIRPPMQIIKTAPGSKIVSSVFFMLLPDQVLVYGDCAVNTNPNAEQLADIAIQSADSAKQFGIPARVAMISYSTLNSGSGIDVDLVREATEIVKEKRKDIEIEGPLQYDAAIDPEVAKLKFPGSKVAGRATVFIFPNLTTGNALYKAVQRSANLLSIGPMLQGMKKPVNDLSRGASIDDIVYTIVLTAIQAMQLDKK